MADILRLKYNQTTLPTSSDRLGETVGHWTGVGNHSISADATHAYTGTKSLKIASTGAGSFGANYVNLNSAYNATFTVGKNYCITLWVYASGVVSFQVLTGGVTSAVLATVASTWTPIPFTFTCVTATTDINIIITTSGSNSIWFELAPVSEYAEVPVLVEKGLTSPDQANLFPALQYEHVDGSMQSYFRAFRRRVHFESNIITTHQDQLSILYWYLDNARRIDYGTEAELTMALNQPEGFENTWLSDFSLAKSFTFDLLEAVVRTTFPV